MRKRACAVGGVLLGMVTAWTLPRSPRANIAAPEMRPGAAMPVTGSFEPQPPDVSLLTNPAQSAPPAMPLALDNPQTPNSLWTQEYFAPLCFGADQGAAFSQASLPVGSNGAGPMAAHAPGEALSLSPVYLADNGDEPDSVYAPPAPPREDQGLNQGRAHISLDAMFFDHYVYRGVDHSRVGGRGESANFEIDTKLSFDLGKWPHPFVGVFSDIFDKDPVSRFQEVRPYVGMDLNIRPLTLTAGNNSYLYPQREDLDTSEVFGKITLDDSFVFHTDEPLLSPYIYCAYDYHRNNGWYIEAGVKHDFSIQDTGITLTPLADVAYIIGYQQQFVFINSEHDVGFQHYDVGLEFQYSLNTLFNLPKRFGEFDLKAYLMYTGKLDKELTANTTVWGGVGIGFQY